MLGEVIGDSVGKLVTGITGLFTSDKDRLAATNLLREHEAGLMKSAMDYEAKLTASQASIIVAEATGKGWLKNNWRPLTMLTFLALIVMRWLGLTPQGMSEAELLSAYDLIKLGLGGYVMGRSAEKIIPSVMRSWSEARQQPQAK